MKEGSVDRGQGPCFQGEPSMNQLIHHLTDRPHRSIPTDEHPKFNHLYLTDDLDQVVVPTSVAECHHPTVARMLSGVFTREEEIPQWKP